jgi:hypothetical protein
MERESIAPYILNLVIAGGDHEILADLPPVSTE